MLIGSYEASLRAVFTLPVLRQLSRWKYEAEATNPPGNSRWKPTEYSAVYGRFMLASYWFVLPKLKPLHPDTLAILLLAKSQPGISFFWGLRSPFTSVQVHVLVAEL